MIKKEKNSAQSAAVIFGSTETTTPKTNAEAILEAAEKSFFIVITAFAVVYLKHSDPGIFNEK